MTNQYFDIFRDHLQWTDIHSNQDKIEIWMQRTWTMLLMAHETTEWEKMKTDIQEIKKMVNKMEDMGEEVRLL